MPPKTVVKRAPNAKVLEEDLRKTVKAVFNSDQRDELTIRMIRDKVESARSLAKGYLSSDNWKAKSKEIIQNYTAELVEKAGLGEVSEEELEPEPKPKKTAPKKPVKAPAKKAAPKKEPASNKRKREKSSSALSEIGTLSEPDGSVKQDKKKQESEETLSDLSEVEDEDAEESDAGAKKTSKKGAASKPTPKAITPKAMPPPKKPVAKKQKTEEDEQEDISSELSSVDDEDVSEFEFGASKSSKKGSASKPKAKPTAQLKKRATPKSKAKHIVQDSDDEMKDGSAAESDSDSGKKKKPVSKKQVTPKSKVKPVVEESDEDMKDASAEENDSDAGKKKPVAKKAAPPKKVAPPKKPAAKKQVTKKMSKTKVVSDSEAEDDKLSKADSDAEEKPEDEVMQDQFKKAPTPSTTTKKQPEPEDDDSDMSIVLDEAPKPKRRKSKAETGAGKTKVTKKSKPAAASAKDLSPDEKTIQTLQGQLRTCGDRAVFQFLLKEFADDKKAKIKFLEKRLVEFGMVGKYTKARAAEIKAEREMMEELAGLEGAEEKYGVGSGRAGRKASTGKKNLKEASESEDDEGEESGDNGKGKGKLTRSRLSSEGPVKKPNARAALAFLGDDDEDSD